MITAYNAFRLKQQKAKEAGEKTPDKPRGKSLNDPAIALEFAQKLDAKITGIDTTGWTDEDREKVCAALIALKDKIDIFINPNFGKA